MQLHCDWKAILKKAWSIRLILIAGILTGLEGILPLLDLPLPQGVLSSVTFMVLTAAFIMRLVAQKNLKE